MLRAASIVLFGMYGAASDLISIDLANAVLFTAFACTWTGARVFDHRKVRPVVLFGGAVLWLVLCRLPGDHAIYRARDNGRNRVETASIELILDRVKRGAAERKTAAAPSAA